MSGNPLRRGAIEAAAKAYHNNDPAYAPPYWDDCYPEMKRHYRTVSEAALDALLDYLEAQSSRIWLQEESLTLRDEVALSGLSGLIAALRVGSTKEEQ